MLNRLNAFLPSLFVALAIAGCTPTLEADIARFHALPAGDAETVQVVPADPDRLGSLEFAHYAEVVRAELAENGFRHVSQDPDLIAMLDWRLSEPRERLQSDGIGYGLGYGPGFGHHGFGHGFVHGVGHHGLGRFGFPHGSFGHGFGHGFGHHGFGHGLGSIRSQTIRDLTLTLALQRPSGETVFEGRAQATLEGDDGPGLPAVMPHLARALFADFPGESGRSESVTLKIASGESGEPK